jgi:hypothetical protein
MVGPHANLPFTLVAVRGRHAPPLPLAGAELVGLPRVALMIGALLYVGPHRIQERKRLLREGAYLQGNSLFGVEIVLQRRHGSAQF